MADSGTPRSRGAGPPVSRSSPPRCFPPRDSQPSLQLHVQVGTLSPRPCLLRVPCQRSRRVHGPLRDRKLVRESLTPSPPYPSPGPSNRLHLVLHTPTRRRGGLRSTGSREVSRLGPGYGRLRPLNYPGVRRVTTPEDTHPHLPADDGGTRTDGVGTYTRTSRRVGRSATDTLVPDPDPRDGWPSSSSL